MMKNERIVRRVLISTLPRFWFYSILSFLCALAIQIICLIPPILMGKVIDQYIPEKDMQKALLSIIIFATIPIIVTLFTTFYNYCLNVVGRKMGQKLMLLGFEKIVFQPMNYFDKHNSAEIASYSKTEAMRYVVFWIFDLPQLFASILNGIIILILLIRINYIITLSLLLYIPLSIFPSRFFSKKIESFVKKIVENNAKSNQVITDTCRGIKFIKAMVLETIQIQKVKKVNDETIVIFSKVAAIDNLNASWTDKFLDSFFTGIIFAVSAVLIICDQLSLGMLVLILNYMPKIFSVIKAIANTNFHFKRQLAEYDKFFELIVMEDERKKQDLEKENFRFDDEILFENIEFSYNEERGNVLNGLTLSMEKGKWIGIIGNSGAGKSTIFDLILKLYDGYHGRILVDHVDIKSISTQKIRSKITKVSQEMFLFPGTIRDNLLIIKPTATEEELMRVITLVGLKPFLDHLKDGLDSYIGEDGAQVSGGEKQRICLAQGLLRNSQILLLDEVTANVDTISENNIKKTIRSLMKEYGLTVISISHRLSFLNETDLIYVVQNGRVSDVGTYKELAAHNELFNFDINNE